MSQTIVVRDSNFYVICCGVFVAEDGSLGMLEHLSALLRVDIIQAQQQVHQELAGEPLQPAAG